MEDFFYKKEKKENKNLKLKRFVGNINYINLVCIDFDRIRMWCLYFFKDILICFDVYNFYFVGNFFNFFCSDDILVRR